MAMSMGSLCTVVSGIESEGRVVYAREALL